MTQQQPWATTLVEGEPIRVGERELIPVVKVRSIVRRQVTFGTGASNGSGGGLVWLHPVAVVEHRPDGSEGRIAIPDVTGMTITGMLIGALTLPILYLIIAGSAFLWRRRSPRKQA